jgi:NAD(P)-dependent dehydrogenase (short-subunit alcohol dehydrogenase family)
MAISLSKKVAFVAGGSRGIGLAIVEALLRAGAHVAVAARNGTNLQAALAHLGDGVQGFHVDVTDRVAMTAVADEVERKFGRIHILINNAGAGILVPVAHATYNDWDWALDVNIRGVINGIQSFLPKILAHGEGGHIVSTASMGGLFVGGSAGLYSATKYAVVGMMEALRADLASLNVGVSVFCPGMVRTEFYKSEDGRPERYAEPGRKLSEAVKARVQQRFAAGMDPREAAQAVLQGIEKNELYILTHAEFAAGVRERFEAILAAFPSSDTAPQDRISVERSVGVLSNPVYHATGNGL